MITKDSFRINHYAFVKDCPFDDLVTTSAPYYHFQILKPKDKEQREKAIDYFQEHKKLFVAWAICPDILLYTGCTTESYIRSTMYQGEITTEDLERILYEAGEWYRCYGCPQNQE